MRRAGTPALPELFRLCEILMMNACVIARALVIMAVPALFMYINGVIRSEDLEAKRKPR
jgi:hypothetical protein